MSQVDDSEKANETRKDKLFRMREFLDQTQRKFDAEFKAREKVDPSEIRVTTVVVPDNCSCCVHCCCG